jgi:hypothetical protein
MFCLLACYGYGLSKDMQSARIKPELNKKSLMPVSMLDA